MPSLAQGLNHLRRMANARYFGVPFLRRGSFQMPARIRIGNEKVEIAYPAETGVAVDFLTCFIDDEYGLGKIEDPIKTIADIGANVGFFSMAARSRFPTASIHAYEPNPRILSYLSCNAEAARFRMFPEAVGAKEGIVSIEDTADSNQARTTPPPGSDNGVVRIRQVSLAMLVERLGGVIDLIKIDCEGAEWDLFTDPAPWRTIGLLRMEYHLWGRRTFSELEQSLAHLGFEMTHHHPAGEWGTVWARNRQA